MSAATATKYISVKEYLAAEEVALEKHEYYKGEVFAMAGAAIAHNRIVRNTQTAIDNYLLDKSCEIFPSDLRIHAKSNTLFTYPDLTIFVTRLNVIIIAPIQQLIQQLLLKCCRNQYRNMTGEQSLTYIARYIL